jgi:hypothetical protein
MKKTCKKLFEFLAAFKSRLTMNESINSMKPPPRIENTKERILKNRTALSLPLLSPSAFSKSDLISSFVLGVSGSFYVLTSESTAVTFLLIFFFSFKCFVGEVTNFAFLLGFLRLYNYVRCNFFAS